MMDDRELSYVLQYNRLAIAGHIWSEDSHEYNLSLTERACKQAATSKDYHFFDELGNVIQHTRDRLAPPSSRALKAKIQVMLETYGPKGNEGVELAERNRYANYVRAMEQVSTAASDAPGDG